MMTGAFEEASRLQGAGEDSQHAAAGGQANCRIRVDRQGAGDIGGQVLHHGSTVCASGQNQVGFLHTFVGVVLELDGCGCHLLRQVSDSFSDGVLIVAPWVILYLFTETHRMQAARLRVCLPTLRHLQPL